MFTQLMESKQTTKRGGGGTVLSFIAHYGLILAVIYTSAGTATAAAGPRQEKVRYVEPEKAEPPEPEAPAPELLKAPLPPRALPTLLAPVEIPTVIPAIDLSRAATDPAIFDGRRGPPGPPSNGTVSADSTSRPDHAYLEHEVEKPVLPAPNSAAPTYPDFLRRAGVEGHALVSFVVDTTGRVDIRTFKVISSTHDFFATSVRNALPRMRFIPAETARGKVRQLVQQPFSFAIVR
jgi:protein TonB